jgi:hypothetical protein
MKKRYLQYDKSTGKFSITPELEESDLLEAPDHIIYFRTNEERDEFKRQLETVHPVTPVASFSNNNINSNGVTEVIIEMTGDIQDEKNMISQSLSVKHFNHGGKRPGSGRPKVPKSQAEKDKISQSMMGKKNASKASPL